MCPSYRATGEERYSTRGRARLFQEMLRGDVIPDMWQSDAVREALDLCLACKGCRSDCPTHTDMASYKAEFLSHYYEHKRRPIQAYSMGLIQRWARIAAHLPRVVNFATQTPGLRYLAKKLGGIALQRSIPPFATQTFVAWFRNRARPGNGGRRVLIWPDTFNNHFHPEIAIAAVEVLEAAGCEVVAPAQPLCCGRPLYDFGMLDLARQQLVRIMESLKPDILNGTPIIGLEPACVSVFRDELLNLFPNDELARRLSSQTLLFSDFLVNHVEWRPPRLGKKALVHGHCHQKAVMGMAGDVELLQRLGVDFKLLDSGCCGMSGSFGFKPEHYDVSIRAGEIGGLLPAVRAAAADTLIVTNGYSCSEQIAQCTGRRALHIAEVARMAMDSENG